MHQVRVHKPRLKPVKIILHNNSKSFYLHRTLHGNSYQHTRVPIVQDPKEACPRGSQVPAPRHEPPAPASERALGQQRVGLRPLDYCPRGRRAPRQNPQDLPAHPQCPTIAEHSVPGGDRHPPAMRHQQHSMLNALRSRTQKWRVPLGPLSPSALLHPYLYQC